MSPEMVEAVASLWLLALTLLGIISVVIFRNQLKNFLDKLTTLVIKKGDTEISLTQETKTIPEGTETPGEKLASPEKIDLDIPEKPEPKTTKELWWAMVHAFNSRKIEEGERAFKNLQESTANGVEKLKNEIVYLFHRYKFASDTSSLVKLTALTKRREVASFAYGWIGFCYRESDDFVKAAEAFEHSAHASETEREKASRIVEAAQCIFKTGKHQDALEKIMSEIGGAAEPDVLFCLYEGLSSLYGLAEEPELRALALEKAIEIKPNDVSLLFFAAHSYSEKSSTALALLHYKTLLRFNAEHTSALNNIGVEYKLAEMPILAVQSYMKAAELKETLASANLADLYLGAGFKQEAQKVLNEAKLQADLHPKIGTAISAISEQQEEEKKIEKNIIKDGQEQQRFLRNFADAYFSRIADCPSFLGFWRSHDGIVLNITAEKPSLEGRWTRAKEKYKLTGQVSNRGAKLNNQKMRYLGREMELGFFDDGYGYAYMSIDGMKLNIMNIKEQKQFFVTLEKIKEKKP